jgi:hypothetical protein
LATLEESHVTIAFDGSSRFRIHSRRELFTWADKVAFFLAVAWVALLLFVWFAAVMTCGAAGGNNVMRATIVLALEAGAALVFPIWLVLRIVDAATGGPERRLRN